MPKAQLLINAVGFGFGFGFGFDFDFAWVRWLRSRSTADRAQKHHLLGLSPYCSEGHFTPTTLYTNNAFAKL